MRLLFLIALLVSFSSFAQLNMTQLGYLDIPDTHATGLNDIWGYEDEDGNEYAIVGAMDGVSVVDVTDPANPTEIEWIPGMNSIWRDIKTHGDYAYITTEASEGLLIIDLTPLPGSTTLPYTHYTGPVGNEWYTAHNLYQDDGYVYIFGAGRGNGGVIILDVATDPMNPIEVGDYDLWYAHDGYVQNDTGYFAHINDGFFTIVDLTNKAAPFFINSFTTPSNFTHNIWTTANGDYAFTSDEVSDGYIAAYDISDPLNIQYLDRIQSSPGNDIVPHNVHVLGNYVVTSYYTDGVTVHDVTHPHNMVEVANFDTSPLSTPNTQGCWGVYPFFSSGNIVASDREEGLFVLGPNYQQGAYLEGQVTEFGTSNPLNNVEITISGEPIEDFSNVLGDYATGIHSTGTYDVNYFKVLYYPQTVSTSFTQGNVLTQDVELVPIPQYSCTVTVLDAQTLNPVENASVVMNHTYITHEGTTDVNGEVTLDIYYEDNYEIVAGKWGYISSCFVDTLINSANNNITLYIDQGIYDDFTFDYGWSVFGDATNGMWEREVPVGVEIGGTIENPFEDGKWDCGRIAYITGNGTQSPNTEEVEGGYTTLISPLFDLTGYSDPHINFEVFYFNLHGPFFPDDTLFVSLFNGTTTVDIAKIHYDNTELSVWNAYSIPVSGLLPMTSTMQLIVNISDYPATVNVTDVAFDHFRVTDFSMASNNEVLEPSAIQVIPNPFQEELFISGYDSKGTYEIYDITGKLVQNGVQSASLDVGELYPGLYVIVVKDEFGNVVHTQKQLKQ